MSNKPANGLKRAAVINPQTIASALVESPEALFRAEKKRDQARAAYEARLAVVSDCAINGHIDGPEKRFLSNEAQRKIAIDLAVSGDPDCRKLREDSESSQRDVNLCRNRLENYQLVARLILAQIKQ